MQYCSTRDAGHRVSGAKAILTGLAPDGGLYVPCEFGVLDVAALQNKSYSQVALAVLELFLPDYDPKVLQQAIHASYETKFQGKAGQLEKLNENLYSLELWHGPTAAFKDYALQLMPHLLVEARRMLEEKDDTLILVATSGDTGTAALAGYRDLPGIKIATFYPTGGTSEIQRLQMVTQEGGNLCVYGVEGNFDDAQTGVKKAFQDVELAKKLAQKQVQLSSANSINWGRLVPQIIYYVTSYLALCREGCIALGEPVDYCVPTGNFGDIMAGYYAKKIGLPVGRLLCASNSNNVLSDFLCTGHYDARREFLKTSSPSMDILVSSNLERLLYHTGGDAAKVAGWMEQLAKTGEYQIDQAALEEIQQTFAGGWANENQVAEEISEIWNQYHYLADPHTAVAFCVAEEKLANVGKARPTVVLSTASPFKFSGKVLSSLGVAVPADEFEALELLEKTTGYKAPGSLAGLRGKEVRFTKQIKPEDIVGVPLQL